MAVGKLLKKTDIDLVSTNIKPGVDIFGVSGSYGGLEGVSRHPIGMAYSSNDNDNQDDIDESDNHIRFYDEGTKVICMGCVGAQIEAGFYGRMFYYFEITKSDLTISNYHKLWLPNTAFTGANGGSHMFIKNISGTDRYCFFYNYQPLSFQGTTVYFNGTSLVDYGDEKGTEIGTSDYILHNGSVIQQTDQTYTLTWDFYNPANWIGQTFTATTTDELKAIEVYTRPSSTPTGNIVCELYSGIFGSLLATSDPIDSADMLEFPSKNIFRFSGTILTPGNTYSFKIIGAASNPSGGSFFYLYAGTNSYAGGAMYDNGSLVSTRDLTFKIYFGEYTGRFTGESEYRFEVGAYACWMATTGFLKFT